MLGLQGNESWLNADIVRNNIFNSKWDERDTEERKQWLAAISPEYADKLSPEDQDRYARMSREDYAKLVFANYRFPEQTLLSRFRANELNAADIMKQPHIKALGRSEKQYILAHKIPASAKWDEATRNAIVDAPDEWLASRNPVPPTVTVTAQEEPQAPAPSTVNKDARNAERYLDVNGKPLIKDDEYKYEWMRLGGLTPKIKSAAKNAYDASMIGMSNIADVAGAAIQDRSLFGPRVKEVYKTIDEGRSKEAEQLAEQQRAASEFLRMESILPMRAGETADWQQHKEAHQSAIKGMPQHNTRKGMKGANMNYGILVPMWENMEPGYGDDRQAPKIYALSMPGGEGVALIPGVTWTPSGVPTALSEEMARELYWESGLHLGMFKDRQDAAAYRQKLYDAYKSGELNPDGYSIGADRATTKLIEAFPKAVARIYDLVDDGNGGQVYMRKNGLAMPETVGDAKRMMIDDENEARRERGRALLPSWTPDFVIDKLLPDTPQTDTILGKPKNFINTMARTAIDMVESIVKTAGVAQHAIKSGKEGEVADVDNWAFKLGDWIGEVADLAFPQDPMAADSFMWTMLPSGLASVATFATGGGVAAKLAAGVGKQAAKRTIRSVIAKQGLAAATLKLAPKEAAAVYANALGLEAKGLTAMAESIALIPGKKLETVMEEAVLKRVVAEYGNRNIAAMLTAGGTEGQMARAFLSQKAISAAMSPYVMGASSSLGTNYQEVAKSGASLDKLFSSGLLYASAGIVDVMPIVREFKRANQLSRGMLEASFRETLGSWQKKFVLAGVAHGSADMAAQEILSGLLNAAAQYDLSGEIPGFDWRGPVLGAMLGGVTPLVSRGFHAAGMKMMLTEHSEAQIQQVRETIDGMTDLDPSERARIFQAMEKTIRIETAQALGLLDADFKLDADTLLNAERLKGIQEDINVKQRDDRLRAREEELEQQIKYRVEGKTRDEIAKDHINNYNRDKRDGYMDRYPEKAESKLRKLSELYQLAHTQADEFTNAKKTIEMIETWAKDNGYELITPEIGDVALPGQHEIVSVDDASSKAPLSQTIDRITGVKSPAINANGTLHPAQVHVRVDQRADLLPETPLHSGSINSVAVERAAGMIAVLEAGRLDGKLGAVQETQALIQELKQSKDAEDQLTARYAEEGVAQMLKEARDKVLVVLPPGSSKELAYWKGLLRDDFQESDIDIYKKALTEAYGITNITLMPNAYGIATIRFKLPSVAIKEKDDRKAAAKDDRKPLAKYRRVEVSYGAMKILQTEKARKAFIEDKIIRAIHNAQAGKQKHNKFVADHIAAYAMDYAIPDTVDDVQKEFNRINKDELIPQWEKMYTLRENALTDAEAKAKVAKRIGAVGKVVDDLTGRIKSGEIAFAGNPERFFNASKGASADKAFNGGHEEMVHIANAMQKYMNLVAQENIQKSKHIEMTDPADFTYEGKGYYINLRNVFPAFGMAIKNVTGPLQDGTYLVQVSLKGSEPVDVTTKGPEAAIRQGDINEYHRTNGEPDWNPRRWNAWYEAVESIAKDAREQARRQVEGEAPPEAPPTTVPVTVPVQQEAMQIPQAHKDDVAEVRREGANWYHIVKDEMWGRLEAAGFNTDEFFVHIKPIGESMYETKVTIYDNDGNKYERAWPGNKKAEVIAKLEEIIDQKNGEQLTEHEVRQKSYFDELQEKDIRRPDNPNVKNRAEEGGRERFINAPDGSMDFGAITPEQGKIMGRQAGPIRLQQGVQNPDGTGWGMEHIEARHGEQIRSLGFPDAQSFVYEIINNVETIWKPEHSTQLVLAQSTVRSRIVFIELKPGSDANGDFYTVDTAFPIRKQYLDKKSMKGWTQLWSKVPVLADDADTSSSFAGFARSGVGERTAMDTSNQSRIENNIQQSQSESNTSDEIKNRAEDGSRERFINAPDGSMDFGVITPEQAEIMGRQPGPIRLQQGAQNADGTGWGLEHIEANHGEQIRNLGFSDAQSFVHEIINNVESVWKPEHSTQLVLAQSTVRSRVVFIELKPGSDANGDFYTVDTAFPTAKRYLDKKSMKGWTRLWSKVPVLADNADSSSSFARFAQPDVGNGQPAKDTSSQSRIENNIQQSQSESNIKNAAPQGIKDWAYGYSAIPEPINLPHIRDLQNSDEKIAGERDRIVKIEEKLGRGEALTFDDVTGTVLASIARGRLAQWMRSLDQQISTDVNRDARRAYNNDNGASVLIHVLNDLSVNGWGTQYGDAESNKKWNPNKPISGEFVETFREWLPEARRVIDLQTDITAQQDLNTSLMPALHGLQDALQAELERVKSNNFGKKLKEIKSEAQAIKEVHDNLIKYGTALWFGSRALSSSTDGEGNRLKGQHNTKTRATVIRDADDLYTAGHEFAHDLVSRGVVTIDALLDADGVGEELIAYSYTTKGDAAHIVGEGFAEFVATYLNDPALASTAAPNTYDWFSKNVLAPNRDLSDVVRGVQWTIRAKNNLSGFATGPGVPLELDGNKTWRLLDKSTWRDIRDKLTGGLPIKTALLKYFISKHSALKTIDQMLAEAGNNVSHKDQLYVQARYLQGVIAGRTEAELLHGSVDPKTGLLRDYIDPQTGEIIWKYAPLKEILKPVMQKGLHNEFGKFLLALRTLEYGDNITHAEYAGSDWALGILKEAGYGLAEGVKLNQRWANAKAIREARARGENTANMARGLSREDIVRINDDPRYADFYETAQRVYDYEERLMDYAAESGMFNAEQLETIRSLNQFYVSFSRVMDDPGINGLSGSILKEDRIEKLRGSLKDIHNPISTLISNTSMLIAMAERNKIKRSVKNMVETMNSAGQFGIVMQDITVDKSITMKQFQTAIQPALEGLKEQGLDILEATGLTWKALYNSLAPVYTSMAMADPMSQEMIVLEGGKQYTVRMNNLLWDGLKSLDPASTSAVEKVMRLPASILRAGAVGYNLVFGLWKNWFRDTMEARLYSDFRFIPVYDTLRNVGTAWKAATGTLDPTNPKHRQAMQMMSMGIGASLRIEEVKHNAKNIVNKMYEDMSSEKSLWTKFSRVPVLGRLSMLQHPLGLLFHPLVTAERIVEASEMATRLGVYDAAYHGRRKWEFSDIIPDPSKSSWRPVESYLTEQDRVNRAAWQAKTTPVDFGRQGSITGRINRFVPFYSIIYNDLWKNVERAKKNPVDYAIQMSLYTVLSALTYALNFDNDEYFQLQSWEKDLNWYIPAPEWVRTETGASFIPLPKPFFPAIIAGSTMERAMQAWYEQDPHAFDGFLDRILQETPLPGGFLKEKSLEENVASVLPPGLQQIIEVYTNYDMFRDREIIPKWIKEMYPDMPLQQYDNSTPEWSKFFAEGLSTISLGTFEVSPKVIEHYIKGVTGTVGGGTLDILEGATRKIGFGDSDSARRRPKTFAELPFIKGFIAKPPPTSRRDAQILNDLTNKYGALINSYQRTLKDDIRGSVRIPTPAAKRINEYLGRWDKMRKETSERVGIIQRYPAWTDDKKIAMINEQYANLNKNASIILGRIDMLGGGNAQKYLSSIPMTKKSTLMPPP